MGIWIILLIIIVTLLLVFLFFCHMTGSKFLKNLSRQNPGDTFHVDIDISFYKNGPLAKIAEEGMKYMETLPHEDVYINSEDGLRLHAVLFKAEDTPKKFVIGMHGFQSHARNEFAPYIEFYRSLGYSMLLPDDRAHGESEGQYITMGVKDRRDCVCWAKYITGRFGGDSRILLHGVSMGAAAVLSASGEVDLPLQVKGVISDCGFTSVKEAFAYQIEAMYHISPAFPLRVCEWYAKHKAGFDFMEARPIDQVEYAKVPVLFVQGQDDFLVPASMAYRLYGACNSKKKIIVVEHASHAESIAVAPERYRDAIRKFFMI